MESKDKRIEEQKKEELTIRVGERIKKLRKDRGYTQEDLSSASHIDRAYIGHIEQGIKCISVFTAKKIADGLGITLSELFENL